MVGFSWPGSTYSGVVQVNEATTLIWGQNDVWCDWDHGHVVRHLGCVPKINCADEVFL